MKSGAKKKRRSNHEPTSQIKTSLIVNEDISKQRQALKEICKVYTNGCTISNWNATVTFSIHVGFKLFSTTCDLTPLVYHLFLLCIHHSHGITLNEIKYILAKTIVRPWHACMSYKHINKLSRIVKLKTFRYMRTFTENSKPPKYGIVPIRKCHLREVIGRQLIFF